MIQILRNQFRRLSSQLRLMSTKSTKNCHQPFTVCVEGNIGSGKTVFLEHFRSVYADAENVDIVAEPLARWRQCQGYNLLSNMYKDPKKWAFTFQSYVQLTMLENHCKSPMAGLKLMERSIYSARYCFVEKLSRDGYLADAETAVLDQWFDWICSTMVETVSVDLIVYLRSSPEVVYKRIRKRARSEENTLPLVYIRELHEIHEDWLVRRCLHSVPAPVIIINGDLNLTQMIDEYSKCETEILRARSAVN